MTFEEIKELISVLSETDIAEFNLENEAIKLSIKKGAAFVKEAAVTPTTIAPPPSTAAEEAPVPKTEAPEPPPVSGDHTTISAPMVGTFYRAPSPDSDPYVKVGDMVEAGQPLCIIEAMKLMNEIESEVKGRVVEILVENGQPVEYGQPLFLIEPA